ncbi:hypothetical protein [uncultured Fibrobacter sp.]|uniref:hypothetical protein n=1 Tax=uncultured Fibrobacter sp. TaxID=261512 RepID=UPI0025D96B20|nr:hypothetical protein [uncultured Fibrobacter sp.]
MRLSKITGALIVAGMATAAFATDGDFALKGNVQTQVTKSIADEDNNFSSGWIRANVGGQYKSENLDGTIMLRIFAPEFGNKIEDKKYDKILADLYWVNYKWVLGANDKMNLKIGRWKTDWSQSTHYGTYVDKDLTVRGLWMRDYSHNALELGWIHGLSSLNAMVATKDGHANQGYVRIEEDLKFTFPLEMKFAYRSNAIDVVQNTAYLTHRIAAYASFNVLPVLRAYGEYACVYTQDDDIDTSVPNYIAPEAKYYKPGEYYQPFYIGADFAPSTGILNTLMSNLMVEWEYINRRDNLYQVTEQTYDDWAWTVAWVKKIGPSKLQFSVYSENEMTDVGLAFRLTSTIK